MSSYLSEMTMFTGGRRRFTGQKCHFIYVKWHRLKKKKVEQRHFTIN